MENNIKIDVSVIIPCYNVEKYVGKCLESLIKQTKKELEFIVIDDGSTDSTDKVIKEYQIKDKRIKYFKNRNHGIGYTRNYGIDRANGEYILFVDSDDYIEEDTCEYLYNKAKKDNLDLVICDFYRETEDGKLTEEKLMEFENTNLKETSQLISNINLSPWNKLYKTSLIRDNNIRFIENLKYEDAPFVAISLDMAEKIGKVNRSLNHYMIHNNSETTIRDKRCFDILEIIKIIRDYFKDKKYVKEELNKMTVRMITNYTIQQRNQIDLDTALDFIDKAFNYLKQEIPDYKSNKYYKGRGIRKIIEKNKFLTKLYVKRYIRRNKNA